MYVHIPLPRKLSFGLGHICNYLCYFLECTPQADSMSMRPLRQVPRALMGVTVELEACVSDWVCSCPGCHPLPRLIDLNRCCLQVTGMFFPVLVSGEGSWVRPEPCHYHSVAFLTSSMSFPFFSLYSMAHSCINGVHGIS